MTCSTGKQHSVTLSDDGVVYCFGSNCEGQVGMGHYSFTLIPTPISNIPKMKMVSCGEYFTVCIDEEGSMWSFGHNYYGQLGTGNKMNNYIPEKIQDIPPIRSVICGAFHTLIITNDLDLWSFGYNLYGQLCLGIDQNKIEIQLTPQQTSFSNIINISAGYQSSLFQNQQGEIYGAGFNKFGQLGLGHNIYAQIEPCMVLNQPSNIIQFSCGYAHSLFLDSEGNVFSVGDNHYGALGLGDNMENQNILNQILNIPPIKTISCTNGCNYLLDFDGNIWIFGNNNDGQLGHHSSSILEKVLSKQKKILSYPKINKYLSNISQVSFGCCSSHFLAKGSQDIFSVGSNSFGQLGNGNKVSKHTPQKIKSEYFSIWGNSLSKEDKCWAKSARK